MNWDQVQGQWKQMRGKVQQQWGKPAVFVACAALVAVWLAAAVSHRRWPARQRSA